MKPSALLLGCIKRTPICFSSQNIGSDFGVRWLNPSSTKKPQGSVTAEGLVEVNGQVEGELHCTSLIISRQAHIAGTIRAEQVVVDGTVEAPIQGGSVVLKSRAHVVGDIHHQSLAIESGAFFDGRSVQIRRNGQTPEKLERKPLRQPANRETV
jgi:cytoskeletal protein CcmA (bactofilin family)